MKKTMLIYLMIIGCVLCFSFLAVNEVEAEELKGRDMDRIVEGNNTFATDLYAQLVIKSQGNCFFSPNSVHAALSMTYLGARGQTAKEMANVLHLAINREQIAPAFGGLIRVLNRPKKVRVAEFKEVTPYQLSIANALWAMKDYPFRETYIAEVRENFDAELRELDFKNYPEPSRQTINNWVEKKTNQKIKELLPPGIINEYTRLVLTNAIYFMSNWAKKFRKKWTRDLPFTLTSGTKVTCPQMFQQGHFGYMETEDFQGLSLPYREHDLEMVIFLPKKTDGLAALEKKFTIENLNKWLGLFESHMVKVTLPKFKFSFTTELNDVLKTMGMKLAFIWPGADFTGMTKARELFISAVLHKAFVAVDEEGTEAAAATAVVMRVTAARIETKPKVFSFKADHPFIFIIRHRETGTILFMGRLINPK